jgi:hypothetical protein
MIQPIIRPRALAIGGLGPPGTRKQKFARLLPGHLQVGINGFARLVGQFEPDGASRLFLTHCRTRDCIPVGSNVFDLKGDDIASPQLAVDGQIKQCQWSLVRIDHTCLGQSGGLAPMSFPLFQGVHIGADGLEASWTCMVVLLC